MHLNSQGVFRWLLRQKKLKNLIWESYSIIACLFVCLFVCQKLLYIFIQRGFSISWESNKDPAIPHNQIEYSTPKHNQWPIFMHELAPLLRSNDQMKHLHPFPLGKICVTNISEEKSLVSVPNSPKFMSNDVLHKPKKKKSWDAHHWKVQFKRCAISKTFSPFFASLQLLSPVDSNCWYISGNLTNKSWSWWSEIWNKPATNYPFSGWVNQ